jgi:hypothetical protein
MNQKSFQDRIPAQEAAMPILQQVLPAIEVPVGLNDVVLGRIREAEIRGLYWRILLSFVGLMMSVATIILSWSAVWSEVVGSSFFGLIKMAFTDSDIFFANLGAGVSGLLESFPVLPVLLLLIALFCLIAVLGFSQTLYKVRRTPSPHFV